MVGILNDFIAFMKVPNTVSAIGGQSLKLKYWTGLFFYFIAIEIVIGSIIYFISNQNDSLEKIIFAKTSITAVSIPIVIIVSIVEEFIFRYPLKRLNFIVFGVPIHLCLLTSYLVFKNHSFIVCLSLGVIVGVVLFLFLEYKEKHRVLLMQFVNKNFRLIIWVSVASFAVLHIPTKGSQLNFFFIILLISPQIVGGFILVFTRLKLGILYSVCLHMLFNLTLLMIDKTIN